MNDLEHGFEAASAGSVLALLLAFDETLSAADTVTATDAAAVIARAVAIAVPGAEQASVSVGRRGGVLTLAASGAMAAAGDGIQRELRCGPGVATLTIDDGVYCTGDVDTDPRWPAFAARAGAASGVVSVLALRLYRDLDLDEVTALCLYSTQPDAFDDMAQAVAVALAGRAARVLAVAAHRDRTVHLQRALASNREIGTAMGILMATRKVTRERAFTLLRDASQRSNSKLADIATRVVDVGMLEDPADTPSDPRGHAHGMRSSISP